MNSNQKAVIIGAVVVIVLMGLFPPWMLIMENRLPWHGFKFVGSQPDKATINSTGLLIQWIGVLIITALLCAVLADKKKQ